MKNLIIISAFLFLVSCKDKTQPTNINPDSNFHKTLSYAKGFTIEDFESFKVLEIKNPWPKSDKTYRYALISQDMASKITLNRDEYDGILITPITKIVVTSTTHIPGLELLDEEHTLIGFPGTEYVSSERTRALIDNGTVRELGKNESINTEVLLELRPELVVGFGIDGNNKTFDNIQKAGIPVIFNGEWVEASPLAKAEWIKFFGVLYDKEEEANTIFSTIENDYLEAKKLAQGTSHKPTVLSGAMHKDLWYLPSGTSSEAQILKDANADYLWGHTTDQGSLSLNFENVYDKAKEADIWISPSYYGTMEALKDANAHYTNFKAFKNDNVYSFVNTTGTTGGVSYFELGMARPDLVLKDMIKICHPEVMEAYTPHFFKKLK